MFITKERTCCILTLLGLLIGSILFSWYCLPVVQGGIFMLIAIAVFFEIMIKMMMDEDNDYDF